MEEGYNYSPKPAEVLAMLEALRTLDNRSLVEHASEVYFLATRPWIKVLPLWVHVLLQAELHRRSTSLWIITESKWDPRDR